MGNRNSTKPLENLRLDVEKANVQVNVSVNVEDVNVFIDFRISEVLIFCVFLAMMIIFLVKMPLFCGKCRNSTENSMDSTQSTLPQQDSELPSENSSKKLILIERQVESGMYWRETQPFIIESAKTYV